MLIRIRIGLILGVLSTFMVPHLGRAQSSLKVDIRNKPSIVFDDADFRQLAPVLRLPNLPSAETILKLLSQAEPELAGKLNRLYLDRFGLLSEANDRLYAYSGLTPSQLFQLNELFYKHAVRAVLNRMETNPENLVRFLARDADELYFRVLAAIEKSDKWTAIEKIQMLSRIEGIKLSRLVAKEVQKSGSVEELGKVLALDPTRDQVVDLIDIGYFGSLLDSAHLAPLLTSSKVKTKVNLVLAFRAPENSETEALDLTEFLQKAAALYPAFKNESAMASPHAPSYRVEGVEHQPKWTNRVSSVPSQKVYLMMDVDDVLIKDVDFKTFEKLPQTQVLKYAPGINYLKKYLKRLEGPVSDDKTIHYRILDKDRIESTVVMRPALTYFIRKAKAALKSGDLNIYLTSVNDPARTRAVLEQLVVDGISLKDYGIKLAKLSEFQSDQSIKDPSLFRESLRIDSEDHVFAIDDISDNYSNLGVRDHLFVLPAFGRDQALSEEGDPDIVADHLRLQSLVEQIRAATFKLEESDSVSRLQILAGQVGPLSLQARLASLQLPSGDAEIVAWSKSSDIETLRDGVLAKGEPELVSRYLNWLVHTLATLPKTAAKDVLERTLTLESADLRTAILDLGAAPHWTHAIQTLGLSRELTSRYGSSIFEALRRSKFESMASWFLELRDQFEPAEIKTHRQNVQALLGAAFKPLERIDLKISGLEKEIKFSDVEEYLEKNLPRINPDQKVLDGKGHHTLSENAGVFNGWLHKLKMTSDPHQLGLILFKNLRRLYLEKRFTHFDLLVLTGFIFDLSGPSRHLYEQVTEFAAESKVFAKIFRDSEYFNKHSKNQTHRWLLDLNEKLAGLEKDFENSCAKSFGS